MIRAVKFGLLFFAAAYVVGLFVYLGGRVLLGDKYWALGLLNEFAWLLFLPLPISFGITILLKSWRGAAGNLVLIAIALLWFGPYYLPKSQPVAASPTLKIVTYNIWGDNARLGEVDAWLRKMEPDIVLLQEIPFVIANDERWTPSNLYPYQTRQKTAAQPYGNLFISRYPILSEEAILGEDVGSQHRFTVDVNGQVVAIYNVHMAQPIGGSRLPNLPPSFLAANIFGYDNTVRNQEIRKFLKYIEKEENPYIVAGDFNMSDHAAIYSEVSDVMIDSFQEAGMGFGKSWPVRIVNEIPAFVPLLLRLDYIWRSQHFRTIEVIRGPQLGSDHLPFYAEFELLDP